MLVFTYDGSFEGFLTCVYEGYYVERPNKIIRFKNYSQSFIEKSIYIETKEDKYYKVYKAIREKLGNNILRNIYLSQLYDKENIETIIFNYIELAFKIGPKVELYKQNYYVDKINKIVYKVNGESHSLKGFIRFKDIAGVLYSKVDPDNNILELIMGHFINRFLNERFIIHDERRNKAIIYNGEEGNIFYNINDKLKNINNSDIKDEYEELWKEYFDSTTIKERENKKLQKQMMPKRYWKNILEMNHLKLK